MVKYQAILLQFLEEIAAHPFANAPEIERQVVADVHRNHFQLINVGWHRGQFVYSPMLHFDIRNGQIWVQQNGTELEIGDELIERGVRKEDVVIGFVPEIERHLIKFAG